MTRTFKSHTASASQYNLTRVLTLLVKVTARSFARTFSGNLLRQVYGIIGLTALRLCMSCVSPKRYAEEAPQLTEASYATHDLKIKRRQVRRPALCAQLPDVSPLCGGA